ncbi:MAG: calcium-binding protein, partial [Comamonadaceae bacterium]
DTLQGMAGDDTLDGGVGNDTLLGLAGDDTLDGGVGIDSMVGGAGNDTYSVDAPGDKIVESEAEGTDTALVALPSGSYQLGDHIEMGTLTGMGAVGLAGNDLANSLSGNDAANQITGGAGNDYISGNDGNDTLDGGLGDDVMYGGFGNDRYVVDSAGDQVTETYNFSFGFTIGGTDTVIVALASGSFQLSTGVENGEIVGDGAVNLVGNTAANTLIGNASSNLLSGGYGHDALYGHGGDDTLDGGIDEDRLHGEDGDDTLTGGANGDYLSGGNGSDTFVFTHLDTYDRITDFESGSDQIRLDTATFTQLTAGDTVDLATDTHLRYNAATGYVQYDADGFGSGNGALDIIFVGVNTSLTASDIVLF